MLMRTDPFRELDRLAQQFFSGPGTWSRPTPMPMDAYRAGDQFVVEFDLPGVTPDAIDLDVERNVLTVKAERRRPEVEGARYVATERPQGVFTRQLFLGRSLDTDQIEARYHDGVLTLVIPVNSAARPRRIEVSSQAAASADPTEAASTDSGESNEEALAGADA